MEKIIFVKSKKNFLKFLTSENSIISLGGGGFINVSIRKMCEKNCLSFWLNWKNETIIKRIYKSKKTISNETYQDSNYQFNKRTIQIYSYLIIGLIVIN